jgi:hypothetical protein
MGDDDGTHNYLSANVIGAGGSSSFYVPSAFSTLPSGEYSIVVASDKQLNALVNSVDCGTAGLKVASSYSGLSPSDTGTTMYLAFVMSRAFGANWSSAIFIQNAGTIAADVEIEFFASGNSTPVETFTNDSLAVGETWHLDLSTGTYATAALQGFSGAAKVTSLNGQALAAAASYAPGNGSRMLSYNGVNGGDQTLYATQVSRNYASGVFQGGLSLYNLGGTDTPIQIDFYPAGSTTPLHTISETLTANSTFALYMGPGGPLDSAPAMNGFNGSAVVTVTSGGNDIVGIFNLDSASGAAGAANMIPLSQASGTLLYPQIVRGVGGPQFQSGWQIINTSGTDADLDLTYTRTNGEVVTESRTLAGNSVLSVYVGGPDGAALGTGWNGGLMIESTTPIVGQANFISTASGAKDSLLMYNGFND